MLQARIEYNEEDKKFLDDYKIAVDELSKLVIEVFEKNQGLLLTPVFRELVAKKAHEVKRSHEIIHRHLMVDNPGTPLNMLNI